MIWLGEGLQRCCDFFVCCSRYVAIFVNLIRGVAIWWGSTEVLRFFFFFFFFFFRSVTILAFSSKDIAILFFRYKVSILQNLVMNNF